MKLKNFVDKQELELLLFMVVYKFRNSCQIWKKDLKL